MADLRIPDLGEGVDEGTVIALLVAVGDHVVAGQSVLEIETDKVTLEIPAARAGSITALCVSVDALVRPGDVVLRMADDERVTVAAARPELASPGAPAERALAPERRSTLARSARVIPAGPAARREARQLGVDIAAVNGSGAGGRIIRDDVRAHVRQLVHAAPTAAMPTQSSALPDLSAFGAIKRQSLSRLEQATARNLTRSAALIPHAWVSCRADITLLEEARRKLRGSQASALAPITLSAILTKVVALALLEYPRFNAALDMATQEIVYRDYVNVAVAVDTPRGLLVPVVRAADELSIAAIAVELRRLSASARTDELEPAALRGGGITLSNLGQFGVSAMQPLVNWPQAAILGVAAAADVVVLTEQGAASRRELPLTLGFDHRLINGADAARFLRYASDLLADPLKLAVSI